MPSNHRPHVQPQGSESALNRQELTSVNKHMRQVNGIWHYRFCIAGVRIQRTTRERDFERAEKVARKAYENACTLANGGKLIPTLSALVDEWLVTRSPVMSAAHRACVESFGRRHLYDLGGLPISALTTELVERARNKHLQTHSPASVNHWLRILRLVVNWAVKREILPKLPWRVDMLKLQRRPRPILPVDMARDWFSALDKAAGKNPSIKIAVRLMFGLGLRESEAGGACWEWIDWERSTYTPGATKGREATAIPMPSWIVGYLLPIKRASGLVAANRKGRQMPSGYAARAIKLANKACGIEGITPHRLRGSFATLLAEEGTPVQTIQQVMRHKDVKTTMGYLEVNLQSAALAQDRLGARLGL